jgi:hypothetical protein
MITTNADRLRGDPPLTSVNSFAGCLTLDPGSRSLVATVVNWKGGFESESALYRRVFLFPIPNETKLDHLITFLKSEKTLALCERICDGYSTGFDGERRLGKLTQDADNALSILILFCATLPTKGTISA